MDPWRVDCMIFRAAIVVLIAFSEAASSGATAQTLLEPNPKGEPHPAKLSQPPGSAKQQSGLRTKSCSVFGAGFVQLPGTDTCVKIGGFVTMESTVNHSR
jgi:Porin subfamily